MRKVILFLFFVCSCIVPTIAQNNDLDYYIEQAISNSPLLKDYQNQEISNSFDSLLVKAAYKPQVSMLSNVMIPQSINGYSYDPAITNGGLYSAIVGVNQSIVGRNTISTQLKSVELLKESIKNTVKISEQDLKRSITAQYITAYGDLTQYKLNKELIDLLEKEEKILKNLVEKGVYREIDYLTFLVSVQQQQLLLKQLTIQFKNNVCLLNYLCGIKDTTFVNLTEPDLQIRSLPSMDSSVFFKQFELDSLKLINSRMLVDLNYRPKLNLFADGGFNSTLAETPYKNFGTSVGFVLALPIYDGRQRKIEYSKVDVADKTRIAYKDFYANQYQQKISQLTQQLNSTNNLIVDIKTQLKYSEALITTNGSLIQSGDARIADYIIAISNYLNVKNQLTLNTINRLQIINEINYWNR